MSDPKTELKKSLLKQLLAKQLSAPAPQQFAPGFDQKVKAEARSARDATNKLNINDIHTAQARFKERFDPADPQGKVVQYQAKPAIEKAAKAIQSPKVVKAFAKRTSPETQKYVNETLDAPNEERTPWDEWGPVMKGLHVLDLASTRPFISGGVEAAIDPDKDFSFGDVFSGKLGQPRPLIESLKKAEAGGSDVARYAREGFGSVGRFVPDIEDIGNRMADAGAIGPGAAAGAYLTGVAEKVNSGQTTDFDAAMGAGIGMDPTMAFSFGMKGAAPQFGGQFKRLLRASNLLDKVDSAALLTKADDVMRKTGGTPQFASELKELIDSTAEEVAQNAARAARKEADAAARAGKTLEEWNPTPQQLGSIQDAGERAYRTAKANTSASLAKNADNIFGQSGEFAGRQGLALSPPFMPNKGIEVAEVLSRMGLQVPEQLARKAGLVLGDGFWKTLYKAAPGLAKHSTKAPRFTSTGQRLDYHTRTWLKETIRSAGRGARNDIAEAMNDFVNTVAPKLPDIPDERAGLVKNLMEGSFSREPIDAASAAVSSLPKYDINQIPKAFDQPELFGERLVKEGDQWFRVKPDPETEQLIRGATSYEKEAVTALSEWFDRRFKTLSDAGVLDAKQYSPNWATGYYFPRRWQTEVGADQTARLGPGMGAQAVKGRSAGGGFEASQNIKGANIETDPFVAARKYVEQVERIRHKAQLRDVVGNLFGVDQRNITNAATVTQLGEKYVDNTIVDMMDDQLNRAFQPFLSTAMGKWAIALQKPLSWFKELNTVPNFRYHATNMGGDLFLAYVGGMRSPRAMDFMTELMDPAADVNTVLFDGKTIGQVRDELKAGGILDAGSVGGRFDLGNEGYSAAREDFLRAQSSAHKSAKQGASGFTPVSGARNVARVGKARAGEYARDIGSLGLRRAGRKLAEKWDEFIKGSYAIDRMMQGDPVNIAINRTYEYLPDYMDQNFLVKILRTVNPFGTWEGHMIQNIPKIVARNPAAARTSHKFVQAATEPEDDSAPRYAKEHALTIPLGEEMEGNVRGAAKALTGVDISEGFNMGMQIPDPLWQTASPYMGALGGNIDPFISRLRPELRFLYEQTQGRDVLTKQELTPSTPLSMFPAEFPGVPEALKTSTPDTETTGTQIPWLARYGPEYVSTPIARLVANRILQKMGGEGTSAQMLGRQTPASPLSDNRFALQFLGQTGALPSMYTTDPYTGLQDTVRSESVQKAETAKEDLKRALKRILLRRSLGGE